MEKKPPGRLAYQVIERDLIKAAMAGCGRARLPIYRYVSGRIHALPDSIRGLYSLPEADPRLQTTLNRIGRIVGQILNPK